VQCVSAVRCAACVAVHSLARSRTRMDACLPPTDLYVWAQVLQAAHGWVWQPPTVQKPTLPARGSQSEQGEQGEQGQAAVLETQSCSGASHETRQAGTRGPSGVLCVHLGTHLGTHTAPGRHRRGHGDATPTAAATATHDERDDGCGCGCWCGCGCGWWEWRACAGRWGCSGDGHPGRPRWWGSRAAPATTEAPAHQGRSKEERENQCRSHRGRLFRVTDCSARECGAWPCSGCGSGGVCASCLGEGYKGLGASERVREEM